MPAASDLFFDSLTSLTTPEKLAELAQGGAARGTRLKSNAHIHLPPNFTAFETTAQAVGLARDQGVSVLGASNYYDYSVYSDFAALASDNGIFPLFGIEIIVLIDELVTAGIKINDPGNPGKMYLCGKGISKFRPLTAQASELLNVIRAADSLRMDAVVNRLAAVFAAAGLETGLNSDAVKQRIVARHGVDIATVYLQERHAAQAFQEILFEKAAPGERGAILTRAFGTPPKSAETDAVAIQNEIRSQLMKSGKPAYVPETFVDFDHAYRLIIALGGIPSYPVLADGASPICPYEQSPTRLAAELRGRNVHAVEFIPIRNTADVLSEYVHALRGSGFLVTAGTEHNTLDLLPIEPTCLGGEPIPDDIAEIFWEGACVTAAHQYLTMAGGNAFVGDGGVYTVAYPSPSARIEAYRAQGEALIGLWRAPLLAGSRLP